MMVVAEPSGRTCARCISPLEDGDLRCAICALPVPTATAQIEVPRASILRCTHCGAAIGFDPAHQAPACAFCRSVMTVEQPVDPVETARMKVPFKVPRDLATAALRTWLGQRRWFRPRALRDEAVVESVAPLYWAAWVVDARAAVAWTADSDAGHEKSAWAPHAGEVSLRFEQLVVPASRGLTARECTQLAPLYETGVIEPVAPDDVCESFDAQRSAARAYIQQAIEREAKVRIQEVIPGRRYRRIHVACLLERQTTERIALPAWVLAYRYRDSTYRAIVHGQRSDLVFGSAPIDWTKVGYLAAAVLAVVGVVIAALLAFAK